MLWDLMAASGAELSSAWAEYFISLNTSQIRYLTTFQSLWLSTLGGNIKRCQIRRGGTTNGQNIQPKLQTAPGAAWQHKGRGLLVVPDHEHG